MKKELGIECRGDLKQYSMLLIVFISTPFS